MVCNRWTMMFIGASAINTACAIAAAMMGSWASAGMLIVVAICAACVAFDTQ